MRRLQSDEMLSNLPCSLQLNIEGTTQAPWPQRINKESAKGLRGKALGRDDPRKDGEGGMWFYVPQASSQVGFLWRWPDVVLESL